MTTRNKFFLQLFLLITLLCSHSQTYSACNIVNGKAYGDCAGVTINANPGKFSVISSYASESGIIAGARIENGGTLYLSGISNGNILVNSGGKLYVTGIVNGSVTNNGGVVEIEGDVSRVKANSGTTTISGIAGSITGKGKIFYQKGAVINGKPIE